MEICFGIIPLKKEKDGIKVFLVKHVKGKYFSFPKGHGHENEDPKKIAIRELKEESNLDIENFVFDDIFFEQYSFIRDLKKIEKKVYYFVAVVSGEYLFQKDEILEGGFFSFKEAKNIITYDESKSILEEVEKRIFLDHYKHI